MGVTQLYVTGLFDGVSEDDLKPIFKNYGAIQNIDVKVKKTAEGETLRTFAVVDIDADETNLLKCFTAYNNTLWRGHKIKISKTKESLQKKSKNESNKRPFVSANEEPVSSKRDEMFSKYKDQVVYKGNVSDDKVKDVPVKKEVTDGETPLVHRGVPMFQGISMLESSNATTDSKNRTHSETNENKKTKFSTSTPIFLSRQSSSEDKNSLKKQIHRVSKSDWVSPIVSRLEDFSDMWKDCDDDDDNMKLKKRKKSFAKEQVSNGTCETEVEATRLENHFEKPSANEVPFDEIELGHISDTDEYEPLKKVKHSHKKKEKHSHKKKEEHSTAEEEEYSPVMKEKHSPAKKEKRSLTKKDKHSPKKKQKLQILEDQQNSSEPPNETLNDQLVFEAKVKMKSKSKEEKLEDNQKRLRSLKAKQEEFKSKQHAIKNALASLDSDKKLNKKIVFSDAEDSYDENLSRTEKESHWNLLEEDSEILPKAKANDPKLHLFDDDDDEEEHDNVLPDDEVLFRDKQHFHGKSGAKLLELQSSFGNDERFKMDERFIDEDHNKDADSERDESVTGELQQEEENIDNERQRNLNILKDIVDISLPTYEPRTWKGKKISEMVKYDSRKPEHTVYEKKVEKKVPMETDSPDEEEQETQEPPLPTVSQEQFYEVDPSFETALREDSKPTRKEHFSLLTMFSNMRGEDAVVEKEDKQEYKFEKIKNRIKNPLADDYDSSEDESTNFKTKTRETREETDVPMLKERSRQTFFFFPGDPRLKEGIDFFHRKEELHIDHNPWKGVRSALLKNARIQRKRSLNTFKRRRKRVNQKKGWQKKF